MFRERTKRDAVFSVIFILLLFTFFAVYAADAAKDAPSTNTSKISSAEINKMKEKAIRYEGSGHLDQAIAIYNTILQSTPDDIETHKKIAEVYMWSDRAKETVPHYQKILKEEPDNLDIRKNLANVYSWNGMENEAIGQWKEIHRLEPDNLEVMISLANNYMWTDRPKEAEEMFKKILKKDPGNIQAKTAMADLYTYSARPEKAIELYKQVVDQKKTIEEQKDIYNRMAENYYNTGSYDDAREFYRKLLDVAPGDPVARRQLDNINRLVGPGVFGQFDFYREKGDRYLFREEAGGTYVFENGLRIKASGIIESEIDFDEDENTYKNTYAVPLEVSKYLGDGLTVFVGASWLQFRSIRTSFNYFINYLKTFGPNMTMEFGYSRNSLEQEHYQHADRHRINHTMYYTPIEYFSIATYLSPFYITKGDASNDNYGIDFSITPIVHVMRENPRIDLSYTYARQYYYRKDNYPDRYYEYYMPNYVMANYITAFLHYDYDETLWFEASNSFTFWGKDEFMKYFSENVVTLEYSYLFDKKGDGRIGVAYLWYRRLKGRIEDSQDSQRWILKYSQSF